ncbi:hypothetical protein [Psychromonas ossibalaenae]|uniref:hypothetical protein n=1 Tax=Psychromonas ossibalaenae TaxID=444922 RepID=UPI000382AC76|nr:hypothetical protein [Psychromonas ossibalaenae]
MNIIQQAIDDAFFVQVSKIYTVFSKSVVCAMGNENKISTAKAVLKEGLERAQRTHDIALTVTGSVNSLDNVVAELDSWSIPEPLIDDLLRACDNCGECVYPKSPEWHYDL